MNYVTVFDISKQQFEWWWPAIGLLILALGIVCIKFVSRWPSQKNTKIIGWVMMVFGPIFTIVVYNSQTSVWADWRSAYDRGAYSTVEGVVHDFKPMPYEGIRTNAFGSKIKSFATRITSSNPGSANPLRTGGRFAKGYLFG